MKAKQIIKPMLYLLLCVVLGVAAALIYQQFQYRSTNIEFTKIEKLSYTEAMKEIRRHGGTNMHAMIDGKYAGAVATGLPPGEGHGINPRFVNLGPERAAVYWCSDTEWLIIGNFKVLDYVDGKWQELGFAKTQLYTYRPPAKQ